MSRQIRNFVELAALRDRIRRLPEVGSRIASRAANAMTSMARQSYDAKESVYGKPFVGAKGKALTLKRSGALESAAIAYTAIGRVIRASIGRLPYAVYMLRFGILPKKGYLPQAWEDRLLAISKEEITRQIGGAP